jgi:hypothetical protein
MIQKLRQPPHIQSPAHLFLEFLSCLSTQGIRLEPRSSAAGAGLHVFLAICKLCRSGMFVSSTSAITEYKSTDGRDDRNVEAGKGYLGPICCTGRQKWLCKCKWILLSTTRV